MGAPAAILMLRITNITWALSTRVHSTTAAITTTIIIATLVVVDGAVAIIIAILVVADGAVAISAAVAITVTNAFPQQIFVNGATPLARRSIYEKVV